MVPALIKPDDEQVSEKGLHAQKLLKSLLNDDTTVYSDLRHRDPNNMTVPDVRIFGANCQSWSNAGAHKGLGDKRGHLLFEILKQDMAMRPRCSRS
eukprot:6439834-Alexandrium_andersonii.AAC.1